MGPFIIRAVGVGSEQWKRVFSSSMEMEVAGLDVSQAVREKIVVFLASGKDLLVLEGVSEGPAEGVRIIVERLCERRRLYVFGAGHVGRSIALMGEMLGQEVFLLDDRKEFLELEDLHGSEIKRCLVRFEALDDPLCTGHNVAVVIVTRGHQSDEVILRYVSRFNVGYVGMIGSRRRVAGVFKRLRGAGVSDLFLDSVKAPIGLDIGAKTPQEIAVSVHAEMIKHFSGGLDGRKTNGFLRA